MGFNQKSYYCDDLDHALSYECCITLNIPDSPRFWLINNGRYVYGSSRPCDFELPNGLKLRCGVGLTEEELDYVKTLVCKAEITPCLRALTDEKLRVVEHDTVDISALVSNLARAGKVKARRTEHEYRVDARDLTYIDNYGSVSIPVDSLDQDSEIVKHMISLAC